MLPSVRLASIEGLDETEISAMLVISFQCSTPAPLPWLSTAAPLPWFRTADAIFLMALLKPLLRVVSAASGLSDSLRDKILLMVENT